MLFSRLDNIGIKRSAYLRNLIHEYFNQSEYQKERICFNDEYSKIVKALSDEIVLQFKDGINTVTALAVALEYSVKSEHWYLLYFNENQFNTLYSAPLYEVKNILLRYKSKSVPDEAVSEQVKTIIETEAFDSSDNFILGGAYNA